MNIQSSLNPNLQLSPSFTVADLIPTSTGINNTPLNTNLNDLKNLANVLEKMIKQIGPFRIASAFRNPQVNAAVGGSSTSRHMTGGAADIVPLHEDAEAFWTKILANTNIKNSLGEISYKRHQGSIHVTTPYVNSYGNKVIGSARIADNSTGSVVYRSIGLDDINQYLNKYGVNITSGQAALGIGAIILGLGALGLVLVLRNK